MRWQSPSLHFVGLSSRRCTIVLPNIHLHFGCYQVVANRATPWLSSVTTTARGREMTDGATPKTLTKTMSVRVPIDQLWEAFKNLHQLLPRLLPGFVDSSAIVEGPFPGGLGSVRDCRFNPDVPGISRSKERIEVVDNDRHVFAYSVVEGEVLEKFQSYKVRWSFSPDTFSAGTSVTWTAEVVPLEDPDGSKGNRHSDKAGAKGPPEDDIYSESATLLMKQLEEHLLVTGEYKQPSFKESLREDLLFN